MANNVIEFPLKIVMRLSTRTADKNDLAGYIDVREEDDQIWGDIARMTRKLAPVYQNDGHDAFDFRYRGFDIEACIATDAPKGTCWIVYAYRVDPEDDLEEPDRLIIDGFFEHGVDAITADGHEQRGAFPDCPAPQACECRMRGYDLEMEESDQCVARGVAAFLTKLGDDHLIRAMLGQDIAEAISKE